LNPPSPYTTLDRTCQKQNTKKINPPSPYPCGHVKREQKNIKNKSKTKKIPPPPTLEFTYEK
jgi:hypothetical protein